MSIDVVTYLRNLASPDPYDERPTPHAKELYQAADEIETLRKQLRTEKDSHLSTGHTIGAKAQILFLELAAMTQERDWLDHKSKCLEMERASQESYLTECQAREHQLRAALGEIAWSNDMTWKNDRANAALHAPQDDTALRQWGAKLLREMADTYGYDLLPSDLRRKADELMEGKK